MLNIIKFETRIQRWNTSSFKSGVYRESITYSTTLFVNMHDLMLDLIFKQKCSFVEKNLITC